MTKDELWKDDSGVNILLEFLFSLIMVVILFTIMMLVIGNIISSSDRIVLKEEFDIIANDLANRISAFSSEVYLNDHKGSFDSTVVSDKAAYFDLPEPVKGRQYQVDITYDQGSKIGTVKVSYVSDSNVYSIATFPSEIKVEQYSFNSHQGKYEIYYDNDKMIKARNYI